MARAGLVGGTRAVLGLRGERRGGSGRWDGGAGQHCRHRPRPSSLATFTASPGPRGAHTAQARLLRGCLTADGRRVRAGVLAAPRQSPAPVHQPCGPGPLASRGRGLQPGRPGESPAPAAPSPRATGLTLRLASSRPLLLLSLSTERGSAGGALRVKHRADPQGGDAGTGSSRECRRGWSLRTAAPQGPAWRRGVSPGPSPGVCTPDTGRLLCLPQPRAAPPPTPVQAAAPGSGPWMGGGGRADGGS